jgi:hypothetical protein
MRGSAGSDLPAAVKARPAKIDKCFTSLPDRIIIVKICNNFPDSAGAGR